MHDITAAIAILLNWTAVVQICRLFRNQDPDTAGVLRVVNLVVASGSMA
jgi:hypothetical protein